MKRHPEVVPFLAYTGLRWGEMAALRVQDVDMLRRRVNVSRSVTEAGKLVWRAPKTGERRSVPFPAVLADELAALMAGKGPRRFAVHEHPRRGTAQQPLPPGRVRTRGGRMPGG
jgi:integrase